jgi:hypothetical protein
MKAPLCVAVLLAVSPATLPSAAAGPVPGASHNLVGVSYSSGTL